MTKIYFIQGFARVLGIYSTEKKAAEGMRRLIEEGYSASSLDYYEAIVDQER